MRPLRIHLGLPVLAKELIEQANRRRTYIVRSLYALALFGGSIAIFYMLIAVSRGQPLQLLGQGRWMFESVFWTQLGAIYLLLPAMLCGSITAEKERDTLALLLLTRLSPWEIILQKLLSRIIVVFTFMLLTLPLLAVCYAYGGITSDHLAISIYVLALTCLQVGAVAIMCSAFFNSTAVAFVALYVILGPLYFTVPVLTELTSNRSWHPWPTFFPATPALKQLAYARPGGLFADALKETWSSWIVTAIALVLSRRFLVQRAMHRPRNLVRLFFQALDRFFTELNNALAGGIVLIRDRTHGGFGGDLPDRCPVAWMERARRAIGKPHYLVRIAVATEGPTIVLCIMILAGSSGWRNVPEMLSTMLFIAWPIVGLWLAVQATGTFAVERGRQTLGILLTTPMATRQIIREKTTVLWNFASVLALPLITIYLVEAGFEHRLGQNPYSGSRQSGPGTAAYVACAALSIFIYIPLVVWLSVWLGMWMKTQIRAAIASILTLAGWCALPMLIAVPVMIVLNAEPEHLEGLAAILLISPAMMIAANEFGDYLIADWSPRTVLFLHFTLHAALAWELRRRCYASADRLLGRVPDPGELHEEHADTKDTQERHERHEKEEELTQRR